MSLSKQKIIAFIPARCGSKSIPMKNIRPFLGRPLIEWNIIAAQNCAHIDEIIVSTDCIEIAGTVSAMPYSKLKVYDRDPDTATDESSTESAILDYIQRTDLSGEDLLILMQATSPWTSSKDLDSALLAMKDKEYDSLLSVVPSHSFLWDAEGQRINYDHHNRKRRQDMEAQFEENGAFYINRIQNIIRDKNRLSGHIGYQRMHKYSSIQIDDMDDWTMAEVLMEKILENKEN